LTADTVIVGVGLAGASVGWHLARHERVLLLDQAPQPGAEATAQNAGMVRLLGEDPWERTLSLRTEHWLANPPDDWDDTPPSRITGALIGLAVDPHHLTDAVAHLRARGVRVEACDRPGDLAPAMAGAPLQAAWWLPDARVADPHALVTGFLRGVRRHRGQVRCNEAVLELLTDAQGVCGVRTAKGVVATRRVVIAGGGWSAALAATAGVQRTLLPLRRSVLRCGPHALSHPDHPWSWVDDVGIYVRPESGGWLCSPCDEAFDTPVGPGSTGPVDPLHHALAVDKLERYLPAVADARWASGWTGLRTFAPDRRPMLGADPDLPGLWWAAGLGGFGVTCSFAVGEAVATWMRGEVTPWMRATGVAPGRSLLSRWPIRPDGDLRNAKLVGDATTSHPEQRAPDGAR